MKLAVMQPYLFPYVGYFQLIQAVDTFVVYDDVNYIKGGWINRNYILSQGQKALITLELQGASPNVLINEVRVGKNRVKLLKTLRQNYSKAPQFQMVMPVLEEVLMFNEQNLARYLDHGLRRICKYLGVSRRWIVSSDLEKNNNLKGQEKVLELCKCLDADTYINAPGGRKLYEEDSFSENGIKLMFIDSVPIKYPQFKNDFVPNLSIVDVMMFNDIVQCENILKSFKILGA